MTTHTYIYTIGDYTLSLSSTSIEPPMRQDQHICNQTQHSMPFYNIIRVYYSVNNNNACILYFID